MDRVKEKTILTFLSNDSFIQVNKKLLQTLKGDVHAAIILGELISLYRYFKEKGRLIREEWFYNTISDMEASLCISEHIQRRVIKYLESIRFLSTKKIGSPPQRYFHINFDYIADTLLYDTPIKTFPVPSDSKKEFYRNLNESVYRSIPEFYLALNNIKKDIGEFLFAWSRVYKHFIFEEWKWNSQEFGKINNYWKEVYRNRRPFNFNTLISYFLSYPDKPNLYGFINFDREKYDQLQYTPLIEVMAEHRFLRDKEEQNGY
jgi:hypothetical protein